MTVIIMSLIELLCVLSLLGLDVYLLIGYRKRLSVKQEAQCDCDRYKKRLDQLNLDVMALHQSVDRLHQTVMLISVNPILQLNAKLLVNQLAELESDVKMASSNLAVNQRLMSQIVKKEVS